MGLVLAGKGPLASQFNITSARYYSTDTTTTVPTGASETVLIWNNVQYSSSDVTASGTNNTTFTLNKTGIWMVEFQTRGFFSTGTTTGDIFAYAYLVAGKIQICGKTVPSPITANISSGLPGSFTVRAFNAGDQIQVRMRNSTDQVLNISCVEGEMDHISLTYLQAL